MKFLVLFKKTFLENLRDWKNLTLTLIFAPFFVLLMHSYLKDSFKAAKVIIINHDLGAIATDGSQINTGKFLISELEKVDNGSGGKALEIIQESILEIALEKMKNKSVDLVTEIPENFSAVLTAFQKGDQSSVATLKTYGDATNIKYLLTAIYHDIATYKYVGKVIEQKDPINLEPHIENSKKWLSEFDLYVPGLLILSLMMLMFTFCSSIIREKEKETIVRIKMSNITPTEFLGSIGFAQIVIGLISLGLTYLVAAAMGYYATGSILYMFVIGFFACCSILGISLIVAACLNTIFDLMTIGCFPFFILMFFSGGMMPLPAVSLFSLLGHQINANDILPTTHAINAMNKVLNNNSSLHEIGFEICAILLLTLAYATIGIWMLNKKFFKN
jgi:ABC-2 type transport system permease protein